ncbi:MAG: LPS export ABC transporter permease LptG [Kangiellaceae bacterium]|jgi:lipopolysaccharide export system permease protein|nr:LPS export ABC transporter permease LptG [Kangiellaceae bacterium]
MFKLTMLDRYIGKQVLLSILFTGLVLVGLRTLFTLLDEAGRIGQGDYGFAEALYYSLLLIPSRVYEFFPMAVLIGGLSALGVMAGQNELTVMRAAGIKTMVIIGSAIKATVVLMVFVFVLGEWVNPVTSVKAKQVKHQSLNGGILTETKAGYWAKSGQDVVHIRSLADNRLNQVTLFRLNPELQLNEVISAEKAIYINQQWHMDNARIETITPDRVTTKQADFVWQSELQPEQVEALSTEPEMLGIVGLIEYTSYLKENQLDARSFDLAFWRKLAQPFTLVVMVILASSFIFGPMRSVSMGARLMMGIVVGFGFHILNNFFGPVSLVYNFPPLLGAITPVVLFATISAYLLKRAS